LKEISSSSSESQSLSVTTLLNTVTESSKSTLLSAADLNASQIKKQWTVLLTLGTFIAAIIACMGLGHWYDLQEDKTELQKNLSRMKEATSSSTLLKSDRRKKKRQFDHLIQQFGSDELAMVEESLPRVLGDKHFAEKFTAEVKRHHRWLGVAFFYSDSFPRSLRVLSLATHVIVMLFVQSITYNLTNPDDGSCVTYRSQFTCTEPKSSFGTGDNKCSWSDGHCEFIEPVTSFTVVLFVAVFSAMVSTPIAIIQNTIIRKFLAAPTYGVENDALMHAPTSNKSILSKSLSVFQKNEKLVDDSARVSLSALTAAIKGYRETLEFYQKNEFDSKKGFRLLCKIFYNSSLCRSVGSGQEWGFLGWL